MVNIRKKICIDFFKSMILLICSYQMDINKNYNSLLTYKKMLEYLNSYKVEPNIIEYVKINNFIDDGKIIYLTNRADSECMIFHNDTYCNLVFIGTQVNFNDKMSLCKDLWTDICLGLKPIDKKHKNTLMHSKYIDNMNNDDLIKTIIKTISKLNYKKINICGHSMGCGLGMYTSIILTKKFPNIKFNLMTIESPKIGNYKLKKYIDKIQNLNHFDMLNNHDFAAIFPYYNGYEHIANKTYVFYNNGDIELYKNFNKKMSIFSNYSIYDHFTQSVIKNLHKHLITHEDKITCENKTI